MRGFLVTSLWVAGWTIVKFSIVPCPVPGRRFAARRYYAGQSRKRSPDFIPGAVVSLGGRLEASPLARLGNVTSNTPWAVRRAEASEDCRSTKEGSPGVCREGHRQFLDRLFNRSQNRLQHKSWPAGRWRPKNWVFSFRWVIGKTYQNRKIPAFTKVGFFRKT